MAINLQIKKILLAEDDEDDRLFFKDAIDELNIQSELLIVHNGIDLMKHLRKKDASLPDLVFIDINMPGKNGIKALQEIRSDEKLKDIHIIMYSTSSTQKDIDQAFTHGANGYVVKPPSFESLKKIIEKAVVIDWANSKKSPKTKDFVIGI